MLALDVFRKAISKDKKGAQKGGPLDILG